MTSGLRPAALLWDLDGTLVASDPFWQIATTELLESFGVAITREQGLQMVGLSLPQAAKMLQDYGVDLPVAKIVAQKVARVLELYKTRDVAWRPGARELLANAQQANVPNVMVTMSLKTIAETVSGLLPQDTFTALVAGDDVTKGKPDPEAYLVGAQLAGAKISDCVAFEDSPTGLAAAASSGAVTIGVKHLVDISTAPAHVIVDSLQQLDLQWVTQIFNVFHGCAPRAGGYDYEEITV